MARQSIGSQNGPIQQVSATVQQSLVEMVQRAVDARFQPTAHAPALTPPECSQQNVTGLNQL